MYLERLKIFADDNPYYTYGGMFYNCNYINRLPNCTEYLILRFNESIESLEPQPFFKDRSPTGYPIAKDFFKETTLPKGYELRDGCGAVFDGKNGHVCFVERKIDETHAIITESQFDSDKDLRNYKYWNRRTVELKVGKATLSGVGELIGFIYPPIKDIRTERKNKPQIEITEEFVNVRTSANGSIKSVGCYCPMGIYDVLDSKEIDGYLWYRIDKDCWVREGSWLNFYSGDDELTKLKKENYQLKADMKKIEEIIRKWV